MSTPNPKFKSAANEQVQGVRGNAEWKQPLKRHINPETSQLEFVTILVRVLSGDAEHDFHARFPPTTLTAAAVCEGIATKERLSEKEASLFSLWVISKDLELQLRPEQDIFQLMIFWNRWVMKYTHFPEAENAQHPVNRHWFVYKREASVTIAQEIKVAGKEAINLLFGEAKRNILTRRYCCTPMEGATVAAYQLQIALGDFTETKCQPGYLLEDDRLAQLLPLGLLDKMRASQWEEIITVNYKNLAGLSLAESRSGFLEYARKMPCYGCAFFPACTELPPSGFFEFRTQNWFIGIGPNGVCVVDADIPKYVYTYVWASILTCRTGKDQFFITTKKIDRIKETAFISPQAKIIANVFIQCQYKYYKESGKLKGNSDELEKVIVVKSSDEVPRGSLLHSPAQVVKSSDELPRGSLLHSPAQKTVPLKSAMKKIEKSSSVEKGLASKLKGSLENLVGSSAENLNRALRTMSKKLYMNEEDIPVNTEKVKISSNMVDGMIPSSVLPVGYKEQMTTPLMQTQSPTQEASATTEIPAIPLEDSKMLPQPDIAQHDIRSPAQLRQSQAPQNIPIADDAQKSIPKSRMQNMPPQKAQAQSKFQRKARGPLTDAEKAILEAIGGSDNPASEIQYATENNAAERDITAAQANRRSQVPPVKDQPNIYVQRGLAPHENQSGGQSVPKSRFSKLPASNTGPNQPTAVNTSAGLMVPAVVKTSHKEDENSKPVSPSEFKRSPSFGTFIQPEAHHKNSKGQSMLPSGGVARRADIAYGFDNEIGGVGPTELLDMRYSKAQETTPSIQVTEVSDENSKNAQPPLPQLKKRASVFGTAIQPDAQKQMRQSTINRKGTINRRANEEFGFDLGLGGVGPTELLDLRGSVLKKNENKN